jgi:GT2 family glycosyltransferase
MKYTKDVSVIIINYNSSAYTLDCINSVLEKTNPSISVEIIVVDNNSKQEEFTALEAGLPLKENITLVRSRINTGFGGGNMFGAQYASGEYLLFLNNDTMLMNDCIGMHVDFHKNNLNVGVTSAQNYDQDGKFVPSFDHNKGMRKLLFGRSFLEKNYAITHPKRKKEHSDVIEPHFINGAFMFFKASVFGEIGGFDTNIFLYFEEMDVSHRLRQKGYRTFLLPQTKIVHYQGGSSTKNRPIDREGLISYLYIIKKNHPYLKYLTIKYYLFFTFLIKPKKWHSLGIVFRSVCLDESLKQQQTYRHG